MEVALKTPCGDLDFKNDNYMYYFHFTGLTPEVTFQCQFKGYRESDVRPRVEARDLLKGFEHEPRQARVQIRKSLQGPTYDSNRLVSGKCSKM